MQNDSNPRSERYLARYFLNRVSSVDRCRDCGRVTVNTGGLVGVRAVDTATAGITSGYAGLASCGRIWLCPVCNSKVMARRAIDLGLMLLWAETNELHVIWGSLTNWHSEGDRLRGLLDLQRDSWRRMTSAKVWRSAAEEKGGNRVGYVRPAELTVGRNGWHPHFHPIVLMKGSRSRAESLASWMVDKWVESVHKFGGRAQADGAQQLKVLAPGTAGEWLSEYVTKAQYNRQASIYQADKLALEAVWSQSKSGRGRVQSTQAHWSLLDIANRTGDVSMWWELEEATAGHRMLTWSRDIRAKVGLGEESTDEEEAARELGSKDDTVCYITPAGWRKVRELPLVVAGILSELEQGGWLRLRDYLDRNGVDWVGPNEVQFSDDEGSNSTVTQLVERLEPHNPRAGYHTTYIDPELFSVLLKLDK